MHCITLIYMTALILFWNLAVLVAAHAERSFVARGTEHLRAGEYAQAAEFFEQGVADEDAACMNYLGSLYLEGLGRIQSPLIAHGYFQEAAARGNDQACRNLGNLYFNGRGVDVDLVKAAAWWKMSIELGTDPRPAFSLGQLYWSGDGIPKRRDLALKYWNSAKALGSKDAIVALAVHRGGDSIEEWDVEALSSMVVDGPISQGDYRMVKKIGINGDTDVKVILHDGTILPVSVVTAEGAMLFRDLMKSDSGLLVRDVPFVHQADNFCALATSAMLLRHQGVKISQFDVARTRSVHRWGHGSRWEEMVSVAGKLGRKWKLESFVYTDEGYEAAKATLLEELRAGRPAIIDYLRREHFRSAHSVVVCGYEGETGRYLVLNSNLPFPGFQVFSETKLRAIWRSRGFIPNNSELLRPIMLDCGPSSNQSAALREARNFNRASEKVKVETGQDLLLKNNSTFLTQIISNGSHEKVVREVELVLRRRGFRTEQWTNLADIQKGWGVSLDFMEGRITILHPPKKAFIGNRIAEILRAELGILDVKMGNDLKPSSHGVGVLIPSDYSRKGLNEASTILNRDNIR